MVPKLGENRGIGSLIECPSCGSEYLNHIAVDVYERGQDAESGLHVRVENGQAVSDQNMEGNPSSRRHGLVITFECEGCDAISKLDVTQHKGTTYLDMEYQAPALVSVR